MISRKFVENLIAYILTRAHEMNVRVGKVKIQKILYLIDVESYRETGKVLTGVEWIFYKYGPYSSEIESILKDFPVEAIFIGNDRKFRRIFINEPQRELEIDFERKLLIDRVLKKWLEASTDEILNYVYFETEPMIKAQKRGQKLDFSTIMPKGQDKEIQWTHEELVKLKMIGEKLKKALERIPAPSEPEYPENTAEMLAIWDQEEGWSLDDIQKMVGHEVVYRRRSEGENEGEQPVD